MSTPTPSGGFSVSQHLRATKEILQGILIFGTKYIRLWEIPFIRGLKFGVSRIAMTPDKAEFDILDQDVFEILHLIRSWRNAAAPINRIPPEILTLIPDFWNTRIRDKNLIALTHVCRAWREGFISRSALWTDLQVDCAGLKKTRPYLKRSKTSPINVSFYGYESTGTFLHDPLFRTISHAIGRFKSLSIDGTQLQLLDLIAHLGYPAPLLEYLSIVSRYAGGPHRHPALKFTDFGGDLSSLRRLCLEGVHIDLPWGNMVNLTSFELVHPSPISAREILDFFKSAPRLRTVEIDSEIQTSGAQNGRLVPLECLKRMEITGGESSPLLDHTLIPAGARLAIWVDLPNHPTEGHSPRFFDNLKNLPGFTTIKLYGSTYTTMDPDAIMRFSGPNGEVTMTPMTIPQADETGFLLESLTQLDTSKVERLKIDLGDLLSSDPLYRALLPMKDLSTLTLSRCINPHVFTRALDPGMSPSGVVPVCPKLEELVIEYRGTTDIENITETAAVREGRGARLKLVRIVSLVEVDVLELKKHVLHVEWRPGAGGVDSDSDDGLDTDGDDGVDTDGDDGVGSDGDDGVDSDGDDGVDSDNYDGVDSDNDDCDEED